MPVCVKAKRYWYNKDGASLEGDLLDIPNYIVELLETYTEACYGYRVVAAPMECCTGCELVSGYGTPIIGDCDFLN